MIVLQRARLFTFALPDCEVAGLPANMFVLKDATMHRWGCKGWFSVKDKGARAGAV
jgi:hypothetical protein